MLDSMLISLSEPFGSLTLGTTLSSSLTLGVGETYTLVSWWKPLLILLPFIGWAWMLSTIFDKHAKRFFLGQEKWNAIHMIFGVVALAFAILQPVGGFAGLAVGFVGTLAILAIDIGIFVVVANKDHRIPEASKLTLDFSEMSQRRDDKKEAKKLGASELTIVGANKMKVMPPDKESTAFAVRIASEEIIINGQNAHASQIDIIPANENTYAASMLVDGVRQAGEPIAKADAIQIIDFWKKCAGLDLQDRRRKLSGEVSISSDSISAMTAKLVSSGSKNGMVLSLIFNPSDAVRRSPENLGLLDKQLKELQSWADENVGVVLLAAPSDNGRTTTLYSMLQLHDAYTSNIQTIEYEVEDAIEGVKQIVFDASGDGPDFATLVRSTLRRDPDIVGICELPDMETGQNIANSDLDRSRVYLSLKTDNAIAAIQLYVRAVGDPKLAAKGLRGVVSEKLIRMLCGNCKVGYQPTPEMLKKLGLPEDKIKQLNKKGGQVLIRNKPEVCPVCNGVGYSGQTGCFGVFPIEDEERKFIAAQDWNGLKTAMRKRSLPTVQQVALRKAVEGLTSLEEVSRVTASSSKKSSRSSSKATPEPSSK
ncbi:MAG: ATPase, T2SS/T4P/T4SS family [Phycisphaerales bacterium]|nr:ATPase, T2SS/T4P/T4SS family [Phycisphaerales bacterium]